MEADQCGDWVAGQAEDHGAVRHVPDRHRLAGALGDAVQDGQGAELPDDFGHMVPLSLGNPSGQDDHVVAGEDPFQRRPEGLRVIAEASGLGGRIPGQFQSRGKRGDVGAADLPGPGLFPHGHQLVTRSDHRHARERGDHRSVAPAGGRDADGDRPQADTGTEQDLAGPVIGSAGMDKGSGLRRCFLGEREDSLLKSVPLARQDAVGTVGPDRPRHHLHRRTLLRRKHGPSLSGRRHPSDAKAPPARADLGGADRHPIHRHSVKGGEIVIGLDLLTQNPSRGPLQIPGLRREGLPQGKDQGLGPRRRD